MSGLFISFEGPEGAGKTTQIQRLAKQLEAQGRTVLLSREPGGTPLGNRVREVLLDPALDIAPLPEFLLYSASRAQLVQEVIRPALARGECVLLDRYADSSLAYQGYGRGLDLAFLRGLTEQVTGGLWPGLTILLDIEPQDGLARVTQRGQADRLEQADLAFHVRVAQGFLALAQAEPQRFCVIDAQQEADAVAQAVWQAVGARLGVH